MHLICSCLSLGNNKCPTLCACLCTRTQTLMCVCGVMGNANNSNGTACTNEKPCEDTSCHGRARKHKHMPGRLLRMRVCASSDCGIVSQGSSPEMKTPFCHFLQKQLHKVEWANKAKLVMFSVNTNCRVAIELLLMRNHTVVNALLLRKRLDMLERHNGGHGRRRLWSNSCYI